MVSVKAKVIAKSKVETVFSYKPNKALKKSDTIIADSTDAMRLMLWGQAIEKVELDQSYQFTNWKVCYFNGRYLNSLQESPIAVCKAVELSSESNAAAARLKPTQKEVTGRILAMEINKQHVCVNCKQQRLR